MTSSANVPKAVNGAGVEPGDLSPEDAERYAAAFRPIWDLDDAPFAAGGGMSDRDLMELGTGGVAAEVAAALKAPAPSRPATSQAKPKAKTIPTPASGRPARAVPQRTSRPDRGRDESASLQLRALRKSNKNLYIGGGAVAGVILLFLAIRSFSGGPDTPVPPKATASPTVPRDEVHIPPPADLSATNTAVAAPEPPPAPVLTAAPSPRDVRPDPPSAPPPPPAQVSRPAPPTRPTPHAAPPRPPAPTKPKGNGGIVRDNPF